jgi:peptide/nickel transport system substrate-binding protein
LVESWEQPDDYTLIWHIRKGVHWQDKAPVNGREFTAYDVEYHYHRMLGLGSGYTQPTPYVASTGLKTLQSVTATDKYTIVLKWTSPVWISNISSYLQGSFGLPVAREAIEKWGNVQDWRNTITTGPFLLVDYVADSSMTYVKNPNYWGYDARYPENRLPYADGVKFLVITDASTKMAALRTAKIDMLEGLAWEDAKHLSQTNPELVFGSRGSDGPGLFMRTDTPPFNDIRVRKAMQMAIDLKSIANFYYGGTVDWRPNGIIGPALKGYYTPLDEQPKEVQEAYAYNPEGAKKLLAEAGYPNGFKTNAVNGSEVDLLQILVSNLNDIGIDMEIITMDASAYRGFVLAMKHDQCAFHYSVGSMPFDPIRGLQKFYSGAAQNFSIVKDPVFDELVDNYTASMTEQEQQEWSVKASDYIIANYWAVFLPPKNTYGALQPWFKGYNFEMIDGGGAAFVTGYLPFCWIDQNLKKAMGQ